MDPLANEVLEYWLKPGFQNWDRGQVDSSILKTWFMGGPETDKEISERFKGAVDKVSGDELNHWLDDPWHALAGVILMDQFTRNIFRGSAAMYSLDAKALEWCDQILNVRHTDCYHPLQHLIVALPFMHAEDLACQQRCIDILQAQMDGLEKDGLQDSPTAQSLKRCMQFAIDHYEIIERWGRFPHRNSLLGRPSTEAEVKGLEDGSIGKF